MLSFPAAVPAILVESYVTSVPPTITAGLNVRYAHSTASHERHWIRAAS